MANLLEAIEKTQAKLTRPGALGAPTGGQTEQVGQLLRTGQTGRAATQGAGPQQSNIAERVADQQTQQGLQQVQQGAEAQQAEIQANEELQKKADTIQNEGLEEKKLNAQEQFQRQAAAILQGYRQQERELDLSRDKARTEQAGFLLRLSNDKYVQRLQSEGAKSRLTTQVGMNEAIARAVFADELELIENDLGFKAVLGQKQRDVSQELMNIDLASAISMAESQNRAASGQMMWTGVGNAAGAGVSYYASRPEEKVGVTNTETIDDDDSNTGMLS